MLNYNNDKLIHNPVVYMKCKGTSNIFFNDQKQILLFFKRRQARASLSEHVDVPGGHVEDGETPEHCIVREMKEEIDLMLEHFELFSIKEFDDRIGIRFEKRQI